MRQVRWILYHAATEAVNQGGSLRLLPPPKTKPETFLVAPSSSPMPAGMKAGSPPYPAPVPQGRHLAGAKAALCFKLRANRLVHGLPLSLRRRRCLLERGSHSQSVNISYNQSVTIMVFPSASAADITCSSASIFSCAEFVRDRSSTAASQVSGTCPLLSVTICLRFLYVTI